METGWRTDTLLGMSEQPIDEQDGEVSSTPFDDFPKGQPNRGKRTLHLAALAKVLRMMSASALVFAFLSAAGILILDVLHWVRPELSWRVKSALPLIGIGISYSLVQFTLPRTRTEFCLSLAVSLAFVLWGVEQFIPAPQIASVVDDLVVFLFVLDLSIVIRGQLKRHQGIGGTPPHAA